MLGTTRVLFAAGVLVMVGCLPKIPTSKTKSTADAGVEPGGVPKGPGVGAACPDDKCRDGLVCKAGTCQAPGNKVENAECWLSAECLPEFFCDPTKVKIPGGPGGCAKRNGGNSPEGGQCQTEADCAAGLGCALTGLSGTCSKPGMGDFEAACTASTDCQAGLLCLSGKCNSITTVVPWLGVKGCPAEEEAGKVHFQVPRAADTPSEDFFRLPFPNDIRKKDGKVNLTGFPTPGTNALIPIDPVALYLKAITEDGIGFGLNPVIIFRFSRDPDLTRESGGIFKPGASISWTSRQACPSTATASDTSGAPRPARPSTSATAR